MTPPSGRGDGDHRLVLDVELLLVADAVLALDDEVGLGEARVDVAAADLVRARTVRRGERVEDRLERLRAQADAPLAPRAAVARSGAATSATGSAWWRMTPSARAGWSALIELTMFSPGMSARGHDDDLRPVEGRVELDAQQAGVRLRRADRGAVPGARDRRGRRCRARRP